MGTKNLNENGPNPYFGGGGPKIWSKSILWQRLCFGMVSTTSLSWSMWGRYKNEIIEWKGPPIFQNKRVRYARADELELYRFTSEAQTPTYVEVSLLFTHCRRVNTSTARQECATLSLCTTCRSTDRRTNVVVLAGCRNFTAALNSLYYSIRTKVEVNFKFC